MEKGWWHEGRRDGLWETYDPNGDTIRTTVWDKGKFIYRKERESGVFVEKTLDDLAPEQQAIIRSFIEAPPRGPIPKGTESGNKQPTGIPFDFNQGLIEK